MIVNTTFVVERQLTEQWMTWLRLAYVAEALSLGNLTAPLLTRIITADGPADSDSYALQMRARSAADLDRWLSTLQPDLLGRMAGRWGQHVLHFTTTMEEIAL
jgi:hypothetical protein